MLYAPALLCDPLQAQRLNGLNSHLRCSDRHPVLRLFLLTGSPHVKHTAQLKLDKRIKMLLMTDD
ncbi:MAG: hypothetical protein LBL79_00275 [Prevotella sp.]|nr:hypothetical protein [Prevotella sp.]